MVFDQDECAIAYQFVDVVAPDDLFVHFDALVVEDVFFDIYLANRGLLGNGPLVCERGAGLKCLAFYRLLAAAINDVQAVNRWFAVTQSAALGNEIGFVCAGEVGHSWSRRRLDRL